ncbi:MAG: DUF2851 family protein [Verrucomicrobiales bacterium]|nr:DUF2851 family protein [Verrucomicrobiales bacterium]
MMNGYPAAADRYAVFRARVFDSAVPAMSDGDRVAEDKVVSESELEIQARWFGGEFGRSFRGEEGEKVEIVQFGHWNRGAGPDFTESTVRIDGVLHAGAIELDLDARDWEGHGHGSNPEFESVVLHVYTDGPSLKRFFTRTEQHRQVCQVQLPQFAWSQGPPDFLPEAFPGRCTTPLANMTDHEVATLLHSAAQYRLRQKALRFSALSSAVDREQALYQGLAEALGYRSNKTAMAILAQRCPIRVLKELSPIEREAALFGTAGFLSVDRFEETSRDSTRRYLRRLWDCWWKIREGFEVSSHRAIPWCFSGNRPLNHPQRRVAALLGLLARWDSIHEFWNSSQKGLGKIVNNSLNNLSHDYWDQHYTLKSEPTSRPMQLIGKDRRRDILGNVVFPGVMGQGAHRWEEYLALQKVDSNRNLRRAALRLFGEDPARKKLFTSYYYQQQGLLQIYQDFCLEDLSECQSCPFPEQVLQWQAAMKTSGSPKTDRKQVVLQ